MKRPSKKQIKTEVKVKAGYLIVYDDEPNEKFDNIGKLVIAGKLKWIYHKVENNRGYHCYKILKK
jgi:hypothetical protein